MKRRIGMLVGVNAMAWLAVSVGVSACGDTMEPTVINACGSVSPTCAPGANPVMGDSTGANPYCPIGNAGQAIDPQSGVVVGGCDTIQGCHVACVYAEWQQCKCGVTESTGTGYKCAECPSKNGDRRCGVTANVIETYQDGNWIAADCPPDQVCAGMQPDAKCEPDCSATDEVWCDGKCRDTLNDPEKCGPTCETASPCTTADPNAEAYCNTGDCQWKCNAGYKAETAAGPCVPDCASYPGTKWCDGKCRDTLSDPLMCGPNCVTAKPCPDNVPNAVPVCKNGDCQWECEPGYEPETSNGPCVSDCATFPGTEWCNGKCRNTLTDPTWCGVTCETGVTCAASDPNASAVCSNGVCSAVCDPGMTNCSGNCTDIDSDWRNCGACGNQCPNTNGIAGCVQGQCTSTCNDGFIHCPQEPPGGGCETNMFTTTKYCVIKDTNGDYQCYLSGQQKPGDSTLKCNPAVTTLAWSPRPEYVCDPPFTCGHGQCIVVGGQAQCDCDSGYIPSLDGKSCLDANYGNGKDQDVTWSSNTPWSVPMSPLTIPASGIPATATAIQVENTSNFKATDFVLVVSLQGPSAGNWTIKVLSTNPSGDSIHFTSSLGIGFSASDHVIAQKVPQYRNFSIPAGVTLTAPAWPGGSGILAFVVQDTLQVGGTIDMSGKGYVGGKSTESQCTAPSYVDVTNYSGEGTLGEGSQSTSPNTNGGGGSRSLTCYPCGGGGGGNLLAGQNGTCWQPGHTTWGKGGIAIGTGVVDLLILGGGGGAGGYHTGTTGYINTSGGTGGGAILIRARNVSAIAGELRANGVGGAPANGGSFSGGGGGGGTVLLYTDTSPSVVNPAKIHVGGGVPSSTGGGNGGIGRLYLGLP